MDLSIDPEVLTPGGTCNKEETQDRCELIHKQSKYIMNR